MSAVRGTAEIELRSDKFVRPAREAKQAIQEVGTTGRTSMQNLGAGSDMASGKVRKTAAEINAARTATLGLAGSMAGLGASFVGLTASMSNIAKGLNAIEKANVAVERAQNLAERKTLSLQKAQVQLDKAMQSGTKSAEELSIMEQNVLIIRQELDTATSDLATKQEDLKLKQDAYNDTLMLFATSVATTVLTAFTSISIILTQAATRADMTTGSFVAMQLSMLKTRLAALGTIGPLGRLNLSMTVLNITMGKWILIALGVVLAYEGIAHVIKMVNPEIDITIEKLGGDLLGAITGTNVAMAEASEGMGEVQTAMADTEEQIGQLAEAFDPTATGALTSFGTAMKNQVLSPLEEFSKSIEEFKAGTLDLIPIFAHEGLTLIRTEQGMRSYLSTVRETAKGHDDLAKSAKSTAGALDDLKKNSDKLAHDLGFRDSFEMQATMGFSARGIGSRDVGIFSRLSSAIQNRISLTRAFAVAQGVSPTLGLVNASLRGFGISQAQAGAMIGGGTNFSGPTSRRGGSGGARPVDPTITLLRAFAGGSAHERHGGWIPEAQSNLNTAAGRILAAGLTIPTSGTRRLLHYKDAGSLYAVPIYEDAGVALARAWSEQLARADAILVQRENELASIGAHSGLSKSASLAISADPMQGRQVLEDRMRFILDRNLVQMSTGVV